MPRRSKLLILDEPTASLNESDSDALLDLLLEFKRQGIASILISHKLNELAKVADSHHRAARRRHGRDDRLPYREDQRRPHHQEHGRPRNVGPLSARANAEIGDKLFEIRDWRVEHPQHAGREVIKGVNLHVSRGEVVGIAGLMGAGRTELAMSVFGRAYGRNVTGQALMEGREIDLSSIQKAVAGGIAYVTEDRKSLGLILNEDIKNNVTLANLPGVAWHGVIDDHREAARRPGISHKLNIRSSGILQKTLNLSGGNQQKVVLSKWLFAHPAGADSRRADPRHRRRRQIRDLHDHQ